MAQKSRVRSPRAGSQHPALVAHNRPQVQIQGIQCPLCPLKYVYTPCAHKDAHPQVKIKILRKKNFTICRSSKLKTEYYRGVDASSHLLLWLIVYSNGLVE